MIISTNEHTIATKTGRRRFCTFFHKPLNENMKVGDQWTCPTCGNVYEFRIGNRGRGFKLIQGDLYPLSTESE